MHVFIFQEVLRITKLQVKKLKIMSLNMVANQVESVLLKNVLYVPEALIGDSTVYEPTVLVSTSKLVSECNVGVNFVEGDGGEVEFVRDHKIIGKFKSSSMNGLYVDKRRMRSERETDRRVCQSV